MDRINVRYCRRIALIGLIAIVELTASTAEPATTSVSKPNTPPQTAQAQVEQKAVSEESAALMAQITEMRRSEDRLLYTVLWSLGVVVTMAFFLAAFSWWSSNKLYQQDLQRVKDDLYRQLSEIVDEKLDSAAQKLTEKQGAAFNYLQAEMIAHTMGQVSKLRLNTGDILGAIDAAFEQVSAAKVSNTNYVTHAIVVLTSAFKLATEQGLAISPENVQQARLLVIQSGDPFGEYSQPLTDVLDSFERRDA